MTCEQFRALISRDPRLATHGEIAAVIPHYNECRTCREFLNARVAEDERRLGPERLEREREAGRRIGEEWLDNELRKN